MNTIKKNLVLTSIIALLIIGAGVSLVTKNTAKTSPAKTDNKQVLSSQSKKIVNTVSIKADGTTKDYQVQNAVGKTALETTKLATSDIKMTGEGANAFITTINGREASAAKKEFWKLVINGKDAQVGAGSYTVKENDTIGWEIATY